MNMDTVTSYKNTQQNTSDLSGVPEEGWSQVWINHDDNDDNDNNSSNTSLNVPNFIMNNDNDIEGDANSAEVIKSEQQRLMNLILYPDFDTLYADDDDILIQEEKINNINYYDDDDEQKEGYIEEIGDKKIIFPREYKNIGPVLDITYIQNLVALKLYTDFDLLKREFRKSFRSPCNKSVDRSSAFFHWRNALKKTFNKFSKIKSALHQADTLFHGVIKPEIDCKYTDYKVLDISWISDYPDEREYLLLDPKILIEVEIISKNQKNINNSNNKQMVKQNIEFSNLDLAEKEKIDLLVWVFQFALAYKYDQSLNANVQHVMKQIYNEELSEYFIRSVWNEYFINTYLLLDPVDASNADGDADHDI